MNAQMQIDPFITLDLNGLHDRKSDVPPYHTWRQDERMKLRDKDLFHCLERRIWQNLLNGTSLRVKSLCWLEKTSPKHPTHSKNTEAPHPTPHPVPTSTETDKPDFTARFTGYNIPLELYNV